MRSDRSRVAGPIDVLNPDDVCAEVGEDGASVLACKKVSQVENTYARERAIDYYCSRDAETVQ